MTDAATSQSEASPPPPFPGSLGSQTLFSLRHPSSSVSEGGGGGDGGGDGGEEGKGGGCQLVTSLIRRQTRTRSLACSSGRRRLQHQRAANSRASGGARRDERFKAEGESLIISLPRWREKNRKEKRFLRGSRRNNHLRLKRLWESGRFLFITDWLHPAAVKPSRLGPVQTSQEQRYLPLFCHD